MSTPPSPSVPPSVTTTTELHLSPLAPLKIATFRMLYGTWFAANICMWMNDVAAAWMMTSLTSSPIWVALVQTAATLPVFLLGLPCGALADILDRRRYFLFTQLWVACVALMLCVTIVLDLTTPLLLLSLVLLNGVGLAMRWPVFLAIMPDLIPRSNLAPALALNAIAMNASRIIGPLVAGALIAAAGTAWVFALNAVLSVASSIVILRWKHPYVPSPLGREKLLSAMRVGVQFVRQSPRMRSVLLRISLFYFHCLAMMALLPLVAKGLREGGPGTFTLLLAGIGAGAVAAAMCLSRIRQLISRDVLILSGALLQFASAAVLALSSSFWLAFAAVFFAGIGWIVAANTLTLSAQLALPSWVRARGMSMYQMAFMGASALGAAFWGQIATLSNVSVSLLIASATGTVVMLLAHLVAYRGGDEDLTPSDRIKAPILTDAPGAGQVHVTVEYRIDPARAEEFRSIMEQSRRSRLRQGVLACDWMHDIADPARYVEHIIDESWTEHLRRFDRLTGSDIALRERKLAMHVGPGEPKVTRYLSEPLASADY